jgi:hypothetical protein
MIRFDTLQTDSDEMLIHQVQKRMGRMCDFKDTENVWEACNIPKGSEGSIQYTVILTNESNHLARIAVAIWGDLRDFKDVDAVEAWVKKVGVNGIERDMLCVRSGIIYVQPEGLAPTVLRYIEGPKGESIWAKVHCVGDI